jgi:hypothetical protein
VKIYCEGQWILGCTVGGLNAFNIPHYSVT